VTNSELTETVGAPEGAVGVFYDEKKRQTIYVIPKTGEAADEARKRVAADHGFEDEVIPL
jgi:hypothetical protein